jgi:radical SAM protein with 4Fe4S-binding SPASM domain
LILSELTIEVTRRCPLNCLICSSNGGNLYPDELGSKELKKAIFDARTLGAKTVSFSGGEPLEHPQIADLCKYAKKQGFNVHIYTSGNVRDNKYLIGPIDEATISCFARMRVDKMIFGLQGPNEEVHDLITGVSGSFSNAIDSIKKTVKKAIPAEIHCVPTRLNYKNLPELIDLARELGIKQISLLRFVPQGRGETNRHLLNLNREELFSLRTIIKGMVCSRNPQIRIGAPFNAFGLSTGIRCSIGKSRATIRADGRVFPCEATKDVQGSFGNDLHTASLMDIWKNCALLEDARNISHLIDKSFCKDCPSFEQCHGGCPAQSFILDRCRQRTFDPYCLKAGAVLKDVCT